MSNNQGKILFSNKPFGKSASGSKESFTSHDTIYARLETPSTLLDFFKMPGDPKKMPIPFLYYTVRVYPKAKKEGNGDPSNWPFVRLSTEEISNKFWNFDVLPNPEIATTLLSGTSDFSTGKSCAPFYFMFTRERFPQDGEYIIQVKLAFAKNDPYNPSLLLPEDQWPTCIGEFNFIFSTDDLPMLQENSQQANKLVQENAKQKAMQERGLPKEWGMKNAPITSGVTEAKLKELITDKLRNGSEVLKIVIQPSASGSTWLVENDDRANPVMKYHNQPYGCFYRTPENGCRYLEGNLQQNYEGGGNYGDIYFRHYRVDDLDCKFINEALGKKKAK
jgi:hypothetical protein